MTSGRGYQNRVNITSTVSVIDRKVRCNPNVSLMKYIQRLNLIPEGMTGKIR